MSLIGCYWRGKKSQPIRFTYTICHFSIVLGAPGRPIIYSPLSTSLTKESFILKWRRPEETGGDDDITYTVRYSVASHTNPSPWIMKTITTKRLQVKITNLDNKVLYKFEVTAKNRGGESLADERYIQTNFPGGPGGILKSVVQCLVRASAGAVFFYWEERLTTEYRFKDITMICTVSDLRTNDLRKSQRFQYFLWKISF